MTPRQPVPIPHQPTDRQAAFLLLTCLEAFYGGACGGGKSDALLMAALQYADQPKYSALILRRTFPELSRADGLIDRAAEWLGGCGARWSKERSTWTFPSGAQLEFGHLQYDRDRFNYQGAAYQFIGFDELTEFSQTQFRFLFSRLRRLKGSPVPLRMRGASNPGGIGHEWVRARFLIEGKANGRAFVPAKLEDNPHLDQEEYVQSLMELDPITRAQLLNGDWTARAAGGLFKREWFRLVDTAPNGDGRRQAVRFWDLAATEAAIGIDPDWTSGVLMTRDAAGVFCIPDVIRVRRNAYDLESLILQTAQLDGTDVRIRMEQEPGASGKIVIAQYARALAGFDFRGIPSTGPKTSYAGPLASQAEAGNVTLVRAPWNGPFLDEAEAFPGGGHDDQVDAASKALAELAGNSAEFLIWT